MHVRARTNSLGRETVYDYEFKVGTGGHGDTNEAYHTELKTDVEKWAHIYTKHLGAIDTRKMDDMYYTLIDLLKRYIPNYTLTNFVHLYIKNRGMDKTLKTDFDKDTMLCVSKIKGKLFTYSENQKTKKIERIN